MNDPQLINSILQAFFNIVIKELLYLPGLKGMEVKDTINRDFDRLAHANFLFKMGT